MLETYKYKIDFSNVENYRDIHKTIKEALDFPDYYGENLDALWDCLTDQLLSGTTYIEILSLAQIEKFDGYDKKIIDIFTMVKHAYEGEFADRFLVTVVREDGTREEIK
ncbi:MAG: barstar family protein [Clostridia bacterium]|nr:barstar family protein [Clostridia bacterium]